MSVDKSQPMQKRSLSELFIAAVARHGSQACVAKKCGISASMVSLYISGSVLTVQAGNVLKIAHCLGIKPATLLASLNKPVQTRSGLSKNVDKNAADPHNS